MIDRNEVRKMLGKLIRWAVTETGPVDKGAYQSQQIGYLRRPGSKSASIYPYGFNALAPEDILSILLSISGQGDARAHMPISGPDRVKVKPGEVVVYHPATGSKIHFKANGDIDIKAEEQVNIDAVRLDATISGNHVLRGTLILIPTSVATIQGDLAVTGDVEIDGDLNHDGTNVGFYGGTPVAFQDLTGTATSNVLLQNLLAALGPNGLNIVTSDYD